MESLRERKILRHFRPQIAVLENSAWNNTLTTNLQNPTVSYLHLPA